MTTILIVKRKTTLFSKHTYTLLHHFRFCSWKLKFIKAKPMFFFFFFFFFFFAGGGRRGLLSQYITYILLLLWTNSNNTVAGIKPIKNPRQHSLAAFGTFYLLEDKVGGGHGKIVQFYHYHVHSKTDFCMSLFHDHPILSAAEVPGILELLRS